MTSRWKGRWCLLPLVVSLVACAAVEPPKAEREEARAAAPERSKPEAPPISLTPQVEGTPLPPRDPRIAERWPPQIRQLVDNMLGLFSRNSTDRPLSVMEVERKMGITLTERPLRESEMLYWHKQFDISGTPFVDPPSKRYEPYSELYGITRARSPGGMSQHLRLITALRSSGFCLDPYELAVYTGSTFVNLDNSPHATIRYWPPAYVWGMFTWSNTGSYGGRGFSVDLGQNRDPVTRKIVDTGCVVSISVVGRYEEEKE